MLPGGAKGRSPVHAKYKMSRQIIHLDVICQFLDLFIFHFFTSLDILAVRVTERCLCVGYILQIHSCVIEVILPSMSKCTKTHTAPIFNASFADLWMFI